jgi:pimeloyl-ACP methyl ester carboxylesterase
MPTIQINGCNYYYESEGSGAETIVLSHGLLWSGKMFHKQVEHLKDRYRIITYDHRGQGRSEVTESGYGMDDLYKDAIGLIETLNLGQVHFGGLSMGGFVAMRLAARRPDLVKSLILMETSSQPEPFAFKYNMLKAIVKIFGVKSVTNQVMNIMFGQKFLKDPNRKDEVQFWRKELETNKKSVTKAVTGVIDRKGVEDELQNIKCPTLIMVGTQDVATIPSKSEFIHSKIDGSILKYIEGGGHTSSVEEAEQYNREIDDFLNSL